MSEDDNGLFSAQPMDSRSAMAMVDALNDAFTYGKVRGGIHPGRFLRLLHSKGWSVQPCESIPLDDAADAATEGE
jgi:hypothetical protein